MKIISAPFISLLIVVSILGNVYSQSNVIDQVVVKVGGNIILQSDIREQKEQLSAQGAPEKDIECSVIEQLVLQKLFIHQAKLDSVDVSDSQVDAELDRRLRYFVSQFGSEQKLEEYYGKKIIEIKEEFKEAIRDALLAQRMQQKVIGEVQVSPLEIKEYFEKIPTDSLPFVNSEVMVAHIVKIQTISRTRKKEVKENKEI